MISNRLASGNLENLCRETYGTFDTELLVLCTINQIRRDYLSLVRNDMNSRLAYTFQGS